MNMRSVQAILFDFGDVLAEGGFKNGLRALAREQKLDVEDIATEGMEALYDSGLVLGHGIESDFWSVMRDRTGLQGSDAELSARIVEGFIVRPWMLQLIERLRQENYITGILSDQTHWLDRLDQKFDFYRFFDRVYNSYYMGKGKRDVTVFTDVAADLGISVTNILFIDDSQGNVELARSAGMRAIKYADRESFLHELETVLN